MNLRKIAVVGPGLLGGSVALAIRRFLPEISASIWARRESAVADLKERGFDATDDLSVACQGANLVVLATPIGVMADLVRAIGAEATLAESAIVTDVGSVKSCVVDQLSPICAEFGARFLGSHPMAGSEKTGLDHATADLFSGARCVLTPTDETDPDTIRIVGEFWTALGARTCILDPLAHDRAVARISHLPHAAAAAVVRAALDSDESALGLSGGGFRDTTRIAGGAPEMWAEILLENRSEVAAALGDLRSNLDDLLALLEDRDQAGLTEFLSQAKAKRDRLGD
ncbi:MAG: prephenate dehydrogenase [Verrucomicrobiales bacterium]